MADVILWVQEVGSMALAGVFLVVMIGAIAMDIP